MIEIKLTKDKWYFDPDRRLGEPGGFGEVFQGKDSRGEFIAVKRLHLAADESAHRELRIAGMLEGKSLVHIMPVLDSGQDTESGRYYLVMPIAKKNLQDEIESQGSLSEPDAVVALSQIAMGLSEVGSLVHRDLKPENILFHDGIWKISDFGIAKLVEESTSAGTLKGYFSQAYAAPEQWLSEAITGATDIYALGCIAVALVRGTPPFMGTDRAEFKNSHLNAIPPILDSCSPKFRSLVNMMLRKTAAGRPSLSRVQEILQSLAAGGQSAALKGSGVEALRQAAAREEEFLAEKEAIQNTVALRQQQREELCKTGVAILEGCIATLEDLLTTEAPNIVKHHSGHSAAFSLGNADLLFDLSSASSTVPKAVFSESKWDVVCVASMMIRQRERRPAERHWSLFYALSPGFQDYRWWELRFEPSPLIPYVGPWNLEDLKDADIVLAGIMHAIHLAEPPRCIDDENLGESCERWVGLLAAAHGGSL